MPLTREQKILGGVLGLAGLAFGVDRVFLLDATSGVTPVEGAPISNPVDVAGPAPVVTLPGNGSGMIVSTSLDDRFSDLAEQLGIDPESVGDAFSSEAEWARQVEVATTENVVSITEITPEQRIAAFRADHRLTAVMHTGGADWAVINGELYAPGRTIGDFQLMEVTSQGAIFRYGEHRFQVNLPGVRDEDDNVRSVVDGSPG